MFNAKALDIEVRKALQQISFTVGNFMDAQDQSLTTTSDVTFNSIAITSTELVENLNVEYWCGVTLPTLETGKFLTNNGSVLSWATVNTNLLVTAPEDAASPGVEGTYAYDATYFYLKGASRWYRVAWDVTYILPEDYLQKEDGGYILQENGDRIIL
jgi:hypothetical protein